MNIFEPGYLTIYKATLAKILQNPIEEETKKKKTELRM